VVDPPRLIDHVEIEIVVDPKAIGVVFDLVLAVEDPFDVGDDVTRFEVAKRDDPVAMNR
jgi:hypothetical protein